MALRNGRRVVTGFWAEFWDFINRGSVVDLAIAVVIGGAFGRIVESLVADIITPAILNPALASANVDSIRELTVGNGIKYGSFLAAILDFLVIALSVFFAIRVYENLKRRFVKPAEEEEVVAIDPMIASQERLTDAIERLTSAVERRA